MTEAPRLLRSDGDPAALAAAVLALPQRGGALALVAPQEEALLRHALPPAWPPAGGGAEGQGPAALEASLVLGTGGSSGRRRWCVQPLAHLQVSVDGCGQWLQGLGLDPARCQLFNPLPLHHISGLMPLLRSASWGAEQRALPPDLLREPARLRAEAMPAADRRALLSLVPTQLQRLLADPDGRRWLEAFALIWVGGAALPQALADACRQQGLRLAPCYGSTETGAMVAALAPEAFLAAVPGCGPPLPHARLRLADDGALEIQAASLAAGFLAAGGFEPLVRTAGWWRSGDAALLTPEGLQWCGRLDGAINSGGETVFPEQVRERLLALAASEGLPLEALLLLPQADARWGERLVALVRLSPAASPAVRQQLEALARGLPPSQRPQRWLLCPELSPTAAGKWDQAHWRRWLAAQPPPAA
ncbi:MAG: AMP-binding protein [Vulcanococcus sp.]|jgi:O-succinylbenzoic acid--CoA ligase